MIPILMVNTGRRRFLKLAGTVAILGASGIVGLEYLLARKSEPTQPSYSSLISQSIETSSTQLYSLKGRIPFDYNGNGKQDGDEPPVQNVKVQVTDVVDNSKVIAEALTDSSGDYKVDIPAGFYKLHIKSDDPKFRYMCTSPAEFRAITDSYDLSIVGDGRFDVGLMEGFLTLPFEKGTPYSILEYVDISNTSIPIDWMGGHHTYQRGTYKHSGIDYGMKSGSSVLAAAPATEYDSTMNDTHGGDTLWLYNADDYFTYYAHLKEIRHSDSSILRGQLIGLSGASVDNVEHLHFEVERPLYHPIDPYKSLVPNLGSTFSSWTESNKPHYFN
jgi:murein DD-endopeptidase MepM/ murein hydrolase activator NlpD